MIFYLESLCFFVFLSSVSGYNYCNSDIQTILCKDKKHIVCDLEAIEMEAKEFKANVPMTNKLRHYIVNWHNQIRNSIAMGGEIVEDKKFSTATRLRELIWDKELAYIATKHSTRCAINHDDCRNTMRFKSSGQNLAYKSAGKTYIITELLDLLIDLWYDERKLFTNPEEASKNLTAEEFPKVGHYSVIINEYTSRVGCGIAYCQDCSNTHCYYMTCNYDYTNFVGEMIYQDGDTASDCSFWNSSPSKDFSGLCENTGESFSKNE